MADKKALQPPSKEKSQGFNLFGNTSGIPDSQTLISLRLLEKTNTPLFQKLAKQETRFLQTAIYAIESDPLLKIKMGSDTLTASMNLAKILRERVEQKALDNRIDKTVEALVTHEQTGLGAMGIPNIDFLGDKAGRLQLKKQTGGGLVKGLLIDVDF